MLDRLGSVIHTKLAITFQKNGLDHGGFPLASASERVTGLYWCLWWS